MNILCRLFGHRMRAVSADGGWLTGAITFNRYCRRCDHFDQASHPSRFTITRDRLTLDDAVRNQCRWAFLHGRHIWRNRDMGIRSESDAAEQTAHTCYGLPHEHEPEDPPCHCPTVDDTSSHA